MVYLPFCQLVNWALGLHNCVHTILHSVIIHVKLHIPVCGGKLEDKDTEVSSAVLLLECEVELSEAL